MSPSMTPVRAPETKPMWFELPDICALANAERHLGHVVRSDQGWTAIDTTHLNDARTGFKDLGAYPRLHDAKRALEESVAL
jgi:hypothetical protein